MAVSLKSLLARRLSLAQFGLQTTRMLAPAVAVALAVTLAGASVASAQVTSPTVTTSAAMLNGATGFDAGGEVIDDGGDAVTARGVCWNTTGSPTIADSKTVDGGGTGTFTSQITGLSEDTLYYFRAYATNSAGTSYGQLRSVITGNSVEVSSYEWTAAPGLPADMWGLLGGSQDLSIMFAGILVGDVSVSRDSGATWTSTDLPQDAWWQLAASADGQHILAGGTSGATSPGGRLFASSDGGATWTEQQLAGNVDASWQAIAMSADGVHQIAASLDLSKVFISHDAAGSWQEVTSVTVTSPSAACMSADGYTIVLGGSSGDGTLYLSTDAGDTWTGLQPGGGVAANWARFACSSDGMQLFTLSSDHLYRSVDRGVSWLECNIGGGSGIPYYGLACSADGRRLLCAPYFSNLLFSGDSGLTWTAIKPGDVPDSWETVALSSDGTRAMAGSDFQPVFLGQAPSVPPTVTTAAVGSIATDSAMGGGQVTDNGGATVRARGVCWNTTGEPTTADAYTVNGGANGTFASSITGLTASTTYHLRAYATNGAGTAYGDEVTFATAAAPVSVTVPTVTTASVTNIGASSATCGGNVTSDGGGEVTARGVCWNQTGSPTVADGHTTDGAGTGDFASSISGLTPGTTYHVRAYATNSAGTAYGDEVTLITAAQQGGPALGLALSRSDGGGIISTGGQAAFILTVSNTGTADTTNVVLRIRPSGMEFVSATLVPQATAQLTLLPVSSDATQAIFQLPSIAQGQSVQVAITLRVPVAGEFNLQVSATSAELPGGTGIGTTVRGEDAAVSQTSPQNSPRPLCGLGATLSWGMTGLGLLLMRGRRKA